MSLVDNGVQDNAGDQRLGFLVPVSIARLTQSIVHHCIRDRPRDRDYAGPAPPARSNGMQGALAGAVIRTLFPRGVQMIP